MKHLSFQGAFLTQANWKRWRGQCLAGSLTGEVPCSRVTQGHKGRLIPYGNRDGRARAQAGLTARPTSRAGAKAGLSDPRPRHGVGAGLTDKSYPGDNSVVAPESPYRRRGSRPRCRLTASWG